MSNVEFYLAMVGAIAVGILIAWAIIELATAKECHKENLGYTCRHRPGECGDEPVVDSIKVGIGGRIIAAIVLPFLLLAWFGLALFDNIASKVKR